MEAAFAEAMAERSKRFLAAVPAESMPGIATSSLPPSRHERMSS